MPRSLLSAVLSIAGGKLGIILIGIVFTPLLVRMLGPTEYGRYAVVLSIFAFANIFLTSGTNEAVRKFISERDDRDWQRGVVRTLARPAAALAALVAGGFLLAATSGLVEATLGDAYVPLVSLLTLYAVGRQCREFLLRTLMGLQLESYSEPLKVIQKATFSILALLGAYLGYSVAGILVADILTSVLIAILAAIPVARVLGGRAIASAPSVGPGRAVLYPYIGSTILFFGLLTSLYHVDVLFLQVWESEKTVGHYRGALDIAEILWFAPAAIQLALLQRVSGLWEDGDLETIQQHATLVTRYALLFTLLATIGMAALANEFVPLYLGSEFEPAVTPLLILLPGVLGFAAARPTLAINQGRRSLRPLIVATGACALINVLLNATLIPRYGMVGAAVATSIGYGSLAGFQSLAARHIGYVPFAEIRIWRIIATGILAAIPIGGLSWFLNSPQVSLLVVPPVGFVVFCLAALLTGAVRHQELDPVIRYTKRIVNG